MNPDEVQDAWADRSGEYSPAYYAYYGPDERSEAVRERVDRFLGPDAAILELGCSSGRHLQHLREGGFENLAGIDVNDEAFAEMESTYPDLAADGTFYAGRIEDVVADFEDGRFDAVYSVETLQHVHPDNEWVFAELARITDDLLVTVENEGRDGTDPREGREGTGPGDERDGTRPGDDRDVGSDHDREGIDLGVNYVREDIPLFYRDWNRVFTGLGMVEVDRTDGDRDTVRAFRHPTGSGRPGE